jgi:hypothetical protein
MHGKISIIRIGAKRQVLNILENLKEEIQLTSRRLGENIKMNHK